MTTRPLTEEDFWALLARLGGDLGPAAVRDLTEHLATRPEAEIIDFADRLAEALHRIDTRAHAHQDVRDAEDEPGGQPIPMSAENFLAVRCAVVAAGRAAFERVAADPTALAGRWSVSRGASLLRVAPDAYERATDLAWDHETSVNYETGSNAAHWGTTPQPWPPKPGRWLLVADGFDDDTGPPPAWENYTDHLVWALRADPDWRAWWAGSGVADLELYPYYGLKAAVPTQVRRGRRLVRGIFVFSPDRLTAPDEKSLRRQAAEDYRTMFDAVRATAGLPPPPELPVRP